MLRDPIWGSIGVFSAIVIGLFSLWMGYKAMSKKSLTYEIDSANEVASIRDDLDGRVSVLFDGNPVNNPQLIVLTITNSGGKPVASTDFETPININYGDEVQLLTYSVEKASPQSLAPELEATDAELTIQPLLLNPGDHFSIKALLAGKTASPKVATRILGVQEVSEHHLSNVKFGKFMLGFSILLFLGSSAVYWGMVLLEKSVELGLFQAIWGNAAAFAFFSLLFIAFPNKLQKWLGSSRDHSAPPFI